MKLIFNNDRLLDKPLKHTQFLLLTLLFLFSCNKQGGDTQTYEYLFAAENRENVTEVERQEYAPYAWRLERENNPGMPKNFRTCLDDFKERMPSAATIQIMSFPVRAWTSSR